MDEKKITKEILDFQIPEEFVSEFSQEEIEIFNFKLFEALMDKIIIELSCDLDDEKKDEFVKIIEREDSEPEDILEFLTKNVEHSLEKMGRIVFEHKKIIKDFIQDN